VVNFEQKNLEKEPTLTNTTLLFLIKKSQGEITDICLAMKKRGHGINKWNGTGGKVKEDKETIEEAVKRETQEEIDVDISTSKLKKVAELSFYFSKNPEANNLAHVYVIEDWEGEPEESEEMLPQWFTAKEIPFKNMWSDDIFWLPEVVKGNCVKAKFQFGENDEIQEKEVCIVEEFL
jgi:8-oxo-dGTP diphosphatase